MRSIMHSTETARVRELDVRMTPVLRSSLVAMLVRSPLLLVAQGINYVQKERNLAAEKSDDFLDVVMAYLNRVAATDLEVNWFVWLAVVGHFNHGNQSAIPPYLRRENHQASVGAPTKVHLHRDNIFRRLGQAGPGTWSHFTLCDAVDWMNEGVQRHLFEECLRTGRDGGVVLCRTVEPVCPVERVGLGHRLRRIEPASALATSLDRTRLYRGVNFYRIVQ